MEQNQREFELRTAINSSIAGFLYREGELNDISLILEEMAQDYKEKIKENEELEAPNE